MTRGTRDLEIIEYQFELNKRVWRQFVDLRDTKGTLAEAFSKIQAPVVIVHGDHDPHVIEGIEPFLRLCIPRVRLEWLEKCGHYPWIERHADHRFFEILLNELND